MKGGKFIKLFLFFCFLSIALNSRSLYSEIKIADEHPRLLVGTDLWPKGNDIQSIAERVDHPPYNGWYNRLNLEEFHTGALSWLIRSTRGETSHSDSIADNIIESMLRLPLRDGNFYNGENLHQMSLAFDWLYHYPGFTQENKRKLRVKMLAMAEKLITVMDGTEIIWGEEIFHNYCSNAALAVGLTGLALYEGPQDAEAGRLIRIAQDWYFNRTFPAIAILEGGWHEGMAYGLNHFIQETPIWIAAYCTATGEDLYTIIKRDQGNWLEGWIYFCIANIRPDWTFVRSGDNGASRMLPDYHLRQALELIVAGYRNRHGKFLLDELEERLGERAMNGRDLWMPLIFYDDRLEGIDYRELNPTQFTNPGRLGHVTMRSGWGPDATFVHFECGDFFGSHNHLDQAQFTIFYKGALAIDSGYYDSYTPHHKKYAYRAIAHNTILVKDPQEIVPAHRFDDYPSEGGQRALDYFFRNSNYELNLYWDQYRDKAYADMSDIVAWETTPGYDYVAGDATAAYNSTVITDPGARPKISRFVRRLLFVKPDIIAVCDNVDAVQASFAKSWLLHTINEPEISADRLVTVIEKRGQLILSPLLPADVRVEKVGGPNKEFWVNGENLPMQRTKKPGHPAEPGAWRIELKPGNLRKEELFLNLIQVGDAGSPPRYKFKLIGNEQLTGAATEKLVLLFSRDKAAGKAPDKQIDLPSGITPQSRVIIAGLERNGIYRLVDQDKVVKAYSAGQGGVLELRMRNGMTGRASLVLVK